MKTEGISLLNVGMNGQISSKAGKTTEKSFDNIMNVKSQTENKFNNNNDFKQAKEINDNTSNDLNKKEVDKVVKTNQKIIKKTEVTTNKIEEINVEDIEKAVGNLFQDTFGMSLEELVDIAQRLGINLKDLIGQIQEVEGDISIVNIETLQSFVMEVHGIEDKIAFLTNDKMVDELNSLKEGLEEIVSNVTGLDLGKLNEFDENILKEFTNIINQFLDDPKEEAVVSDKTNLNNAMEIVEDADVDIPIVFEEEIQTNTNRENESSNQEENSETKEETSQTNPDIQRNEHINSHENANNAQAFATRLVQAGASEEVSVTQVQTMRNIVVQVVTQIRIRVMPETTNMDIMLHPASLGRVNLHVSMTGSVSTATFTVENQVAKEALESQMIMLKERFEEQGLKVDAVEVNVSEFGLREDEERNQNPNHEKSGSQRNRNTRNISTDDDLSETNETQASRVDINSTVDYTA